MGDFFQSIFGAIGNVAQSVGTTNLYVAGGIAAVIALGLFVLEVVFRRTPVLRPRPALVDNGVRWTPRELLVVAMCAAIFAVTLAITAGIQLIPGFVQARPANALIAVFGILFGVPGALGLGVGNIIGDILSGTLTIGSVGGFLGLFLAGYISHKLLGQRNPSNAREVSVFYLVTFLASLFGTGLLISFWLQTSRILPPQAVWAATFPSIFFVTLYPQWLFSIFILKALYRPLEQRGWVSQEEEEEQTTAEENGRNDSSVRPRGDGGPAVEVRGLTVRYRNSARAALEDVDLTVERGELVAVLGATGAGKTTLCRTLSGQIPHAMKAQLEGEVVVDGVGVAESSVAELSQHVGSVFEDAESQIFGLTVENDVAFGLENFALPPDEIRQRVDEALSQVRMAELAERPSYELSGGQKQRLVIAAALAMRPPVMVLDEPTAELDPVGKRQVLELLADLASEGMAIVVAEQITEGMAEVFDRVLVLDGGHPSAAGPATEVLGDVKTLEDAGVRPPQIALTLHLALPDEDRVPATLEEAVSYVHARWSGDVSQRAHGPGSSAIKPNDREHEAAPSTSPAIEAEGLSFVYPGGVEALQDVTLSVERGEMIALAGENGAGKSTFVRHLNGLVQPQTGTLRVDGVDTRDRSVAELARHVGYIFQNPDHQIWAETVREELAFGPGNLGFGEQETQAKGERAMEAVELRVSADEHPGLLGGGDRQKLAVAGVLAMNPDILVLDEPSTGLDWPATKAIMELMTELNAAGHTIVVITHDMWILAEYVPRTVVMSQGRIIGDGPTPEILADGSLLAEAYLEQPAAARLADSLGLAVFAAPTLGAKLRELLGKGA